jgi:hypothetical protein
MAMPSRWRAGDTFPNTFGVNYYDNYGASIGLGQAGLTSIYGVPPPPDLLNTRSQTLIHSRATPTPAKPVRLDPPTQVSFGVAFSAVKLVELEMTRLSATLRSKPFWWIKFRDTNILAQ